MTFFSSPVIGRVFASSTVATFAISFILHSKTACWSAHWLVRHSSLEPPDVVRLLKRMSENLRRRQRCFRLMTFV
ncbi:hypothetical protein D9M70_479870 [compost metagenome]